MAVKHYYELLELPASASQDEIKKAFRHQIALYHPDKVQHLGKEFQEIAAVRAANLTEAYRILSDEGRRAESDRALAAAPPPAPEAPPAPAPEPETASRSRPEPQPHGGEHAPKGERFRQERTSRDDFIHKASITKFRQALQMVGGSYDDSALKGFDIACVPKSKLFSKAKGPRVLGRFVSRVDADAVTQAWSEAGKWSSEEICIFLLGAAMAPAGELAGAIAAQRRKTRTGKVTLIPVDARNWESHMPTDAPPLAKTLLEHLRSGK